MSKTAAFFTLLGMAYDSIPENYVNQMIIKNPDSNLNPSRLLLIKQGKTHDLPLLVEIVQTTTDIEIPESILNLL